jgi:hypothetical protein
MEHSHILPQMSFIAMNDGAETSSNGCIDRSKTNTTTATTTAHNLMNTITNAPSNNIYWDLLISDEQLTAASDLALTPELSPSLSLCSSMSFSSPAIGLINSPFNYESLGFEFDPSPTDTIYDSFEPSDEPLALLNTPAGFDFDFDFNRPDASQMVDFQLFPDCTTPESAKLKKILLEPSSEVAEESDPELVLGTIRPSDMSIPQESESFDEVSAILKDVSSNPLFNEPSPFLDTIDTPETPLIDDFQMFDEWSTAAGYAPESFTMAKSLGQDLIAPDTRVAPRKPVQSPTKAGFKPNKRPRRRRITSEEASRVVPEDDPNGIARFKCSECSKTFSRPFNLKSHRAIHLGLKPHACNYTNDKGIACHWSFARRHDLERHVRSRHCKENTSSEQQ